jgi:DNA uptake protein ComE-like DNA-binding protein
MPPGSTDTRALEAEVARLEKERAKLENENVELAKRVTALEEELGQLTDQPGPKDGKKAQAELKAAISEREDEHREQLRAADAELTEWFEEREAGLIKRIEELESELTEAKQSAKAARSPSARKSTAESKSTRTRKRTARSRRSSAKNGKIDLNVATFEELRNLGLSVTQSARMIAYRDVRGGFQSLDELDDIPGLSSETRRDLKGRLQLGS